jgi:glycerophosphoryl diester phosphodiesterase
MRIYAHRGASASEPENTLRAFQRALDLGVDGIELDVQATADRVPVILHDRDLARTTNGTGHVDELSLDDLQQLDAGRGEHIPTLREVLELVGDRVHLDIEVKQAGIEREIMAALARRSDVRYSISSFDWRILETLRSLSPEIDLWPLTVVVSDALIETASRISATAVALYAPSYTTESATHLREAGLNAVIWTVNDLPTAQKVQQLGATALCTDVPEAMLADLARESEGV